MEKFTDSQVATALRDFLKLGEDSLGLAHKGYFSNGGWAARCLRWHLEQIEKGLPLEAAGFETKRYVKE